MKVLAINHNQFQLAEMKEIMHNNDSTVFFAENRTEAIHYLDKEVINFVFLNTNSVQDMGLVKYINDNYQNVSVFLCMEKPLAEAFSIAKTGRYELLHNPVELRQIRDKLLLAK